jgi:hypothetical protein
VATCGFRESFANNSKGWSMGPEWAIGAATASTCGNSSAGNDPGTDHSSTADNGVAGMVLGGCYSVAAHADSCLTSPVINTSTMGGTLTLGFWRHLHTDYPSYVTSTVQVSANNGSSWTTLYSVPAGAFVNDAAWTNQTFDVTAQKSATFRVRFCQSVPTGSGVITGGGWNIDDLSVTSSTCP